jgi:hypothetical protein
MVNQDFEPLALGSQQKIPATAINSFGAWLYASREVAEGTPDWCFFPSWLAVLASGQSKSPGSTRSRCEYIYRFKQRLVSSYIHPLLGYPSKIIPHSAAPDMPYRWGPTLSAHCQGTLPLTTSRPLAPLIV